MNRHYVPSVSIHIVITNTCIQKTSLVIRTSDDRRARYSLVGVVMHKMLSPVMGHYTAFVRSSLDKMQWYHIDDNEVNNINIPAVTFFNVLFIDIGRTSQCSHSCNAGSIYALL